MISRIRLEGFGRSVEECNAVLERANQAINGSFPEEQLPMGEGERHIQRDLTEPSDSRHAYTGRLILYPNIGLDESGVTEPGR
jgi:hypothetical protein